MSQSKDNFNAGKTLSTGCAEINVKNCYHWQKKNELKRISVCDSGINQLSYVTVTSGASVPKLQLIFMGRSIAAFKSPV